ncbi:hypothetical protein LTR91_016139 [Friedmanniomyces endolithicus]|uniref:SCP domain-containing protein n=1 Tax=Friedmanniomyces endolithicus TaxID=329885 RepID=A0AAN6K8H4_9PEZI|nr:hypothetical protein LTR57_016534 [Friedmanniomyces endolithicus]KAK0969880.1 hypothetical protein LTR91_016139 [Friedmanniomyces endolithicus]KAK0975993.1 hypothetical protein LTS01_013627 [Friedmanniomyces endolithicus]KAK1030777.1 hypothetical protein LTS16_018619 [Friedmanniomyces endolithicus]
MRYALISAALVAGALAIPHQKRDVVIDYDYVTVTDIVTVTAGAEQASTTLVSVAADVASSSSSSRGHWGHHSWHAPSGYSSEVPSSAAAASSSYQAPSSSAAPSSTEAPASSAAPASSSYQAPSSSAAPSTSGAPSSSAAPTTPTSTYVAPTSTYVAPTSTYVAPTTTSQAPSSTYVAPSSSAAPASTSPLSVFPPAPTGYNDLVKYHHNIHRSNHSVADIEWDDGLASTAAIIAAGCWYAHNQTVNGGGYGQNIAAGVDAANISAIITDLFYNGEVGWYSDLYNQEQPDMTNFEHWGHFSQIVWSNTTKVGCATQYCNGPNGLGGVGSDIPPYFTVCNYSPPGNYANEYGDNVKKPRGDATAEWNAGA